MIPRATPPAPLVSIILPTFNRVQTLGRAIASILAQDITDFELIVVDDGSTDDSDDVVRGFDDPRIRYLRLPANRGAHHARNAGLALATGRFVTFQDSDDKCLPGKLTALLHGIRCCPDAKVSFVRARKLRADGTSTLVPGKHDIGKAGCIDVLGSLLEGSMISTPLLLIERRFLDDIGGFDESRTHLMEDWDLCIRLAKRSRFSFVDEVQYVAYVSDDSISNVDRKAECESIESIISKHMAEYRSHQDALAVQLLKLAVYSLQGGAPRSAARYLGRALRDPDVGPARTVRAAWRLARKLLTKAAA